MLKKEIIVGGVYLAKVSGKIVPCKVTNILDQTGWNGRAATTYCVTNMTTGREVKFRSATKFRKPVSEHDGLTDRERRYASKGPQH